MEHVTHDDVLPIYDENSKILILGSMPSKKSREAKFYYAHPQNRFWKVLETVLNDKINNKKEFILKHHIALWDVIYSCDITASSDASIKNVIPNDITTILESSSIKAIFTNGKTAEKYYQKYLYPKTHLKSICLPSTSPANCRLSSNQLEKEWAIIKEYLKD
ncbi:MAG: DNA-deoxyinosine glycosylase [Bacilli bacterium]|nr:DNA-deoxyinosine glycosylase [Bacilli bacterium]